MAGFSDSIQLGTVDVPAKIERDRFFKELSYVELSLIHAGPVKPGVLQKWRSIVKMSSAIGLLAPFALTHRTPPKAPKLWPHDDSTGDFRIGKTTKATIAELASAASITKASCVVFQSPEQFSPSAANRATLERFFSEAATVDAIGENVSRVWVPGGLWEPRAAVKLAGALGVTCALDPMVHEPGETDDPYVGLKAKALYFRIAGLGRAGAIRNEKLEDLAALILEHYEDLPLTVAFASPERWADARNLKALLDD